MTGHPTALHSTMPRAPPTPRALHLRLYMKQTASYGVVYRYLAELPHTPHQGAFMAYAATGTPSDYWRPHVEKVWISPLAQSRTLSGHASLIPNGRYSPAVPARLWNTSVSRMDVPCFALSRGRSLSGSSNLLMAGVGASHLRFLTAGLMGGGGRQMQ